MERVSFITSGGGCGLDLWCLYLLTYKCPFRFSVSLDEDREAIPYPEVVMSAKDGIYLHFKEL